MRILIASPTGFAITPSTGYAGIERLAYDFANELAKRGEDVTLFTSDDTIVPENVSHMKSGYNASSDLDQELLGWENNKSEFSKFDIVHDLTHQHYIPRFGGIKISCISIFWHDPYIAKFPQAEYNVVALSEWASLRFKNIYCQEAIFQETILVDPEKYVFDKNIKREDWFLFIGKMSHEKGALNAISICQSAGEKLKLVGSKGMARDSDSYQKVVESKIGEGIEYLGEVSDEDKINLLQRCKALVYPVNQMEVSSMKSMEAIMCGCPVITYDKGAMSHVVKDGETGILVTSKSEFRGALKTVGHRVDPEKCHEIGKSLWGKEVVVDNYLKLYKEVGEGRRWF